MLCSRLFSSISLSQFLLSKKPPFLANHSILTFTLYTLLLFKHKKVLIETKTDLIESFNQNLFFLETPTPRQQWERQPAKNLLFGFFKKLEARHIDHFFTHQ